MIDHALTRSDNPDAKPGPAEEGWAHSMNVLLTDLRVRIDNASDKRPATNPVARAYDNGSLNALKDAQRAINVLIRKGMP